PRSFSMRWSRSWANFMRWPSWPSSQAMRNCRPLMVTVTCDMVCPFVRPLASARSAVIRFQNVAHRLDRHVESPRYFAIGGLQHADARGRSVEVGGEARPVVPQRIKLLGKAGMSAVGLAAPLDGRFQRIHGKPQAPAGGVDRTCIRHCPLS